MSEVVIINKELRNPRRNLSEIEKLRLLFLMELDSVGSRTEYKRCLSEFIAYMRSEFTINELRAERDHINSFKNHLLLNKKNSKATINKKLAVVSGYFKYLQSKRVVESNPSELFKRFRMANIGKSVAITREEIEKIYNSMPTRNIYEIQKKTMVVLLFETGMRISELLSLRIESIKRDFGVYVFEFEQKGGVLHRVQLNDLALSYLGNYLENIMSDDNELPANNLLFYTRNERAINRKNFYRMLKSIARNAKISVEIHPHTSRVSFIRQKHENGVDIYSIRRLVGHSSVRTTERYLG